MSQPISTPRPTFTAKPIFTQALMIWLIIFEISSETFNYIHVTSFIKEVMSIYI